ncbi:hypothetical protein BN979_04333 [Mycolicibacterium vulneris]|nr:hypothetical protein BN979_04333 [Mycolicibacterium vulneris]
MSSGSRAVAVHEFSAVQDFPLYGTGDRAALLSPELKFHSVRTRTPACAERQGFRWQVAEFMGHANPTTERIYPHVYKKGDHDDVMSQLGATPRSQLSG